MILGFLLLILSITPPQFTKAGKAKLERMVQERDALTAEWKKVKVKSQELWKSHQKRHD
ncbi:hypothetical protein V8V91_12355 [Algoriphagus halophilus]|uniref:hypothetical protein n=1 Tax=Algoriphagus halophilus TaxID=226505 RepID=UPI00358E8D37